MEVRKAFIGNLLEIYTDKETYEVENYKQKISKSVKRERRREIKRKFKGIVSKYSV
jgi:hypothetical protein